MLIATIAAMLFVGIGAFTGFMVDAVPADRPGADGGGGHGADPRRSARRRPGTGAHGSAARAGANACCRLRPRAPRPSACVGGWSGRTVARCAGSSPRRAAAIAVGPTTRLEVLLDSRSPERRALVVETVLSLPLRRLFLPFLPALRRRYML